MYEPGSVAGLVLMGGRASRMGGGDKALIEIGGRPALSWLIERFGPQVGSLALSANGDPVRFSEYPLPVIADEPGDEGPLAGVLAGLGWAAKRPGVTHLATVPGDAPLPPRDLVSRLMDAAVEGPAVAVGPSGVEPLHALWPLSLRDGLAGLARQGVSSPKRALDMLGAVTVRFIEEDAFFDLDTPADLERAKFRFDNPTTR